MAERIRKRYYRRPFIPATLVERIWQRIERDPSTGCWNWIGSLSFGYGAISCSGHQYRAHRIVYEILVGPIPDGLEIDHLCHNQDRSCGGGPTCPHRRCVNPAHLEATTHLANVQRGRSFNRAKTHCPQGHPYDDANTYVHMRDGREVRDCRTCATIARRKYLDAK